MPSVGHALRSGVLALFLLPLLIPSDAFPAVLYKQYTIQRDSGWDILCEPYIVQRNDYVSKLLHQKGDIAAKDQPEFFAIFMRLNPHISNVNHIRPGQQILIPLKKLPPGAMPGQASGIVTIPFLKISKAADVIKEHATIHTVQPGECVSAILSRKFGTYQSPSYQEGVELFQQANPQVKNINLIYPGQKLYIPDPAIRHEPWYPSLFSATEAGGPAPALATGPPEPPTDKPRGPLDRVASALDATLLKKGKYFFPREDGEDVMFDLARYPVMEFKDSSRMVLVQKDRVDPAAFEAVKAHWPGAGFVPVDPDAPPLTLLRAILDGMDIPVAAKTLTFLDQGVQVTFESDFVFPKPGTPGDNPGLVCIVDPDKDGLSLPASIRSYLAGKNIQVEALAVENAGDPEKDPAEAPADQGPSRGVQLLQATDQNAFLHNLAPLLGGRYAQKVHISFPYAGVQVSALANLLTTASGQEFVVDFGSLYGEAVTALEASGLGVIQFRTDDHFAVMIQKIQAAIGLECVVDPTFTVASPAGSWRTAVKIPGFLLMVPDSRKVLLTVALLPPEFVGYLSEEDVQVIQLVPADTHKTGGAS